MKEFQVLQPISRREFLVFTAAVALSQLFNPPRITRASEFNPETNFPIKGGRFYTETNEGKGLEYGYGVRGEMWRIYQEIGREYAWGPPVSREFIDGNGRITQVFQRGAVQLTITNGRAQAVEFMNIFDELSKRGHDDWLESHRSIPLSRDWSQDQDQPSERVISNHLAILDADSAIKRKYLEDPQWMEKNGLPMAVKEYGNVIVVRGQRAVFQRWKEDVPWAKKGQVTLALGGDIAKERGLLPAFATLLENINDIATPSSEKPDPKESQVDLQNIFRTHQQRFITAGNTALEAFSKHNSIEITKMGSDYPYPEGFNVPWYLNNPQFLEADMQNPENFEQWLRGQSEHIKTPQKIPEINLNRDNPYQLKLEKFVNQVVQALLLTDPSRISSIEIGDENLTGRHSGAVEWNANSHTDKFPIDLSDFAALIHELIHASVPDVRKIYDIKNSMKGKFSLPFECGTLPDVTDFYVKWFEVFSNNYSFFEKRFFSIKGDGTRSMIATGDFSGFQRAMAEFIAMLATDFIVPDRNVIHPNEWPEDIVEVVNDTWRFIFNGRAEFSQRDSLAELEKKRGNLRNVFDISECTYKGYH